MGKGKKKEKKGGNKAEDKGEDDMPPVSGLSISEGASTSQTPDDPSTSQAPDPPEEGLTGGGRRKNKKQKQAEVKAAVVSEITAPLTQVQSKPETEPTPLVTPEPKPETKVEEDNDGLGLGLSGAKRKPKPRPKKKSAAAIEAATGGEVPSGPPQPIIEGVPPGPQPVLAPTQEQPVPQQWQGKPTAPPGIAPPPGIGHPGPPPGMAQPPQRQAGFGRGQPGPRPVGSVQPGTGPSAGQPGPWAASPAPAGPWQASAPHPAAPPGPSASQQASGTQQPQSQRPQHAPSQRPQPPAASAQQPVPVTSSRLELSCRFRIPAKTMGGMVRHIPTKVMTNYLPMTFKTIKVYRYDVTVKPDRPKKMFSDVFKKAKEKHYRNDFIAFDQAKNCYSLMPLKDVPQCGTSRFCIPVQITDCNNRVMNFEVTLKFTGVVDFSRIKQHMDAGGSTLNTPSEEIQCIDVILRQGALESYVKSGRTFFKRPNNPINLSGGMEIWTGLFQSAIFTSRAFINIDVAHKGFPIEQPLVMALTNGFRLDTNCRVEDQRSREVENFLQFIKNLKVKALIVGSGPTQGQTREYMCNGLVDIPQKITFTLEHDDKKTVMSVYDYYTKEKGYKIKYPKLNCVWVGHRDKSIYYPMELLTVGYGQPINKQLNDMQLACMVKEAATPPYERKAKIEEVAKNMNYSSNIFFKKFGLEISDKFLEVGAKILTPPNLDVGDRSFVTPRKGAWQTNRLVKPELLASWGFIAIDCNPVQCNFEDIKKLLLNTGRQMGMNPAEPRMMSFNVRMTELRNFLFQALEKEIRFLFIIVSSRGKDIYHKVKQMAERDVGILTQCIKEYTASRRMNPQTIKNILLKVNSKLMGINQVLDNSVTPNCIKGGDVMIVGADVTHPSPEQTSIPSIAAVTASLDPKCFIYNIELSIQTPKKEMIVEFDEMMFDHLKLWRERNRAMPKKIYVFRDGVSEGQFAEVMNSELAAVHKAYQRFVPNGKPEVLFLLVQKRHHTRFFTVPQCNNVEPGTVVDTHIVHPKELDFYLVSHQAIKGTARPTRYHAICNDGNIPCDEVEQLTFYLCHLYARCMRSVSYPTPTYYAHLACLRARSLTHGQTFDFPALEKKPQRLRVLDKMLRFSRMFFV